MDVKLLLVENDSAKYLSSSLELPVEIGLDDGLIFLPTLWCDINKEKCSLVLALARFNVSHEMLLLRSLGFKRALGPDIFYVQAGVNVSKKGDITLGGGFVRSQMRLVTFFGSSPDFGKYDMNLLRRAKGAIAVSFGAVEVLFE